MAVGEQKSPVPASRFGSAFAKAQITAYIDATAGSRGSSSRIVTLAWSPLGNLLATGAANSKLRVWNPERANVKHSTELRGHLGSVERVAFNPVREAELASCGVDGLVKIWDVRSKKQVAEIKTEKELFAMAWTPDGNEILAGSKDDALIRISRSELSEIGRHQQTQQTNHSSFSHSGEYVFLTRLDGSVLIAEYPSFSPLHVLKAHTSSSFVTCMSPTGAYLGAGGTDALVTLWNTTSWHCSRTLAGPQGAIRSLSFSWDGGYVIAGGEDDRSIEIIHVDTGECVHKVDCHGSIGAMGWSPKDYSLAYAIAGEGSTISGLRIISGSKIG